MANYVTLTPPGSPQFDDPSEKNLFFNLSQDVWDFEDSNNSITSTETCFNDEDLELSFKNFIELNCDSNHHISFPQNFSLLWDSLSQLRLPTANEQLLRSDVNSLLLSIFSSFRTISLSNVSLFFRRYICIINGVEFIYSNAQDDKIRMSMIHSRVDIWSMLLKILDSIPIDFQAKINEAFDLEPFDASLHEYIADNMFDMLVDTMKNCKQPCDCHNMLWILLIRYGEKVAGGWFKYLHRKMLKIRSGKSKLISGCFENLWPKLDITNSASSVNADKLWTMYWSILLVSAPLHKKLINFPNYDGPLEISVTLKFATFVWIIRTQFLGDAPVTEDVLQHALRSLLRLTQLLGPSVEVQRSLWLYFSRKLDSKMDNLDAFTGTNSSYQQTLHDIKLTNIERMSAFGLFCRLTRDIFVSHPTDVLNILRTALPSLTRLGVRNYFTLIGHLMNVLDYANFDSKMLSTACTELAKFVSSLFGVMSESVDQLQTDLEGVSWWLDWELGRRCAALWGLQLLVLIIVQRENVQDHEERDTLRRLSVVISSFRKTLLIHMRESGGDASSASSSIHHLPTNRLMRLGWKDELITITVDFCQCLLTENRLFKIFRFSSMLDASLFDALRSSGHHRNWLEFVLRILHDSDLQKEDCPTNLIVVLWTNVFARLLDLISSSLTGNAYQNTSMCVQVAVSFLSLSIATYKFKMFLVPSPETILNKFAFGENLSFAFRKDFLLRFFGEPSDLLQSLLTYLCLDSDGHRLSSESAWLMFVAWLTNRLLYFTLDDDDVPVCQSAAISLLASVCPDGNDVLASLFSTADADIVLLRLTEKFEASKTFQERMTFKELVCNQFSPLIRILCASVDRIVVLAKSYNKNVPNRKENESIEVQVKSIYAATAVLFHVSTGLLYTSAAGSIFERLVSSVILPRPVFELSLASLPAVEAVKNCICERLPEFLGGIAQLNFSKDPYLIRLLRDLLRLIFFNVNPQPVAAAILVSLTQSFRAHLLNVLAQELVSSLNVVPSETPTPLSRKGRLLQNNLQQPIAAESQSPANILKNCAKKWFQFRDAMNEGTQSASQHLRDAPFLLWPVAALLLESSSVDQHQRTDIVKKCDAAFVTFVRQWNSAYMDVDDGTSSEVAIAFRVIHRTASPMMKSIFARQLTACPTLLKVLD